MAKRRQHPYEAEALAVERQLQPILNRLTACGGIRVRAGRSVAVHSFQAAALARELVIKHSVKPVKKATLAAFESIRDRLQPPANFTYGAVERAYRKLKATSDCSITTPKGNKLVLQQITPGFIDDALARSRGLAQGGQPPFAFVLVRLFYLDRSGNK